MTTSPTVAAPGSSTCCGGTPAVPPVEFFASLPTRDLIARYRKGVENYDRRVFWLSASDIDTAFLPDAGVGRWPIRVLLGHLADAEMVLVHRMRKVVAEDKPVLHYWDEDAFIDANMYGHVPSGTAQPPLSDEASKARVAAALGGFVAVVHTLRQWTGAWLESLDDAAFLREGMHTQAGPQSLKSILAYDAWHIEHHARFLKLKVDRLTGNAPSRAPTVREGVASSPCCGPNCGCKV
jgi:hypothetical protein